MNNKKSVAIIGSGAWGTALSKVVSPNVKDVLIISQNQEVIECINNYSNNKLYLPDIYLPDNITASDDILLVDRADVIFIVVPSQYVRHTLLRLKEINSKYSMVICSKGIEKDSLMLMSEVAHEILPGIDISILSGPNLALEVALNKPSSTTIAAEDPVIANMVSEIVRSDNFIPEISDDLITNQICGAAKNILAIASGIIIGRELGENARASMITRGISEIRDLAIAKGGKEKTIFGYGGLGDILLTCNSAKSRNTSLGIELAKSKSLKDVLQDKITIAEGVESSRSVVALAKKLNVNMPICSTINGLLHENLDIDIAVNNILKNL